MENLEITTGRRRMDPLTRAANAAAKRARLAEERNIIRRQGWRPYEIPIQHLYLTAITCLHFHEQN